VKIRVMILSTIAVTVAASGGLTALLNVGGDLDILTKNSTNTRIDNGVSIGNTVWHIDGDLVGNN